MLLAALSLMHEQIHQAGNAKRCQLVEAAITHFVKRFRPVLLDNSQQDEAGPVAASGQPVAWQQVRTLSLSPHALPGLPSIIPGFSSK